MKTKSYLIIGSNSFLAVALIKKICAKGDSVLGIYHKNIDNLNPEINHIQISELLSLNDVYDAVFIISAFVPNKLSSKIEEQLFKVNVELVETICQQFKKSKIIYCSSVSVYKENSNVIYEHSISDPVTEYGNSKLLGEKLVIKQNKYAIVRIASMYGMLMKLDTFLSIIIKNAIETDEIVLHGNGKRLQNYIHVSDVANYLLASVNHKKNTILLAASKTSYSNHQIAKFIKSILPKTKIIFRGIDNSKSYIYDNSYTNAVLGIEVENKIQIEVKELIEWIKKGL